MEPELDVDFARLPPRSSRPGISGRFLLFYAVLGPCLGLGVARVIHYVGHPPGPAVVFLAFVALACLFHLLPTVRQRGGGCFGGFLVGLIALMFSLSALVPDRPRPDLVPRLSDLGVVYCADLCAGLSRAQVENVKGPGKQQFVPPVPGAVTVRYPQCEVVYRNDQVVAISGPRLRQNDQPLVQVGDSEKRLLGMFREEGLQERYETPQGTMLFHLADGKVTGIRLVALDAPRELTEWPQTLKLDGLQLGMTRAEVTHLKGNDNMLQPHTYRLRQGTIVIYRDDVLVGVVGGMLNWDGPLFNRGSPRMRDDVYPVGGQVIVFHQPGKTIEKIGLGLPEEQQTILEMCQ